jgi:hypothetical protein
MKAHIFKLFIIALFINPIVTFSQVNSALDQKNGFRDFKLGDSFDKWKASLKYVSMRSDGDKLYEYTGTCCNNVFSFSVNKIQLVYSANKLVHIFIELKPFEDARKQGGIIEYQSPNPSYERLLKDFNSLFGYYSEKVPLDEPFGRKYSTTWEGTKTVLVVDYYFLGTYDYALIGVLDKNHYESKTKDGF